MEVSISRDAASTIKNPPAFIESWDRNKISLLAWALADIAILLDKDGVIVDLAYSDEGVSQADFSGWLGQAWVDTVTIESRPKIEAILKDVAEKRPPRWRQVNHASTAEGGDLPVRYIALGPREDGCVLVGGRALRAISQLQQRLVAAQQSMEHDYARVRHAETRYRLLFQLSSEAVLVVDASTRKVIDANPAASQLLSSTAGQLLNRVFPDAFGADSVDGVVALLATVSAAGRAYEVRLSMSPIGREFLVSASLFRDDGKSYYLVRLAPLLPATLGQGDRATQSPVVDVVEIMPDGFVVTDANLRILAANASFLELAQLTSVDQVRGESLDRWLGRSAVDVNVLSGILREHGRVRLFSTSVRGSFGAVEDVEVAGVTVKRDQQVWFGLCLRRSQRPVTGESLTEKSFPRTTEQLTELIGRVPLKDLVKETTDLIERLCIEAALELTGDNRASAAEMLGLSRQSLYVKLRRYGFGEGAQD